MATASVAGCHCIGLLSLALHALLAWGLALQGWLGEPLGVRIQGPVDGAWRLVAPDDRTLCDALAAVPRPPGRLRLEVDPLRL